MPVTSVPPSSRPTTWGAEVFDTSTTSIAPSSTAEPPAIAVTYSRLLVLLLMATPQHCSSALPGACM
eukprot:5085971-Prymnesium_polylepis.2